MKYAGWFVRVGANTIDGLVLAPALVVGAATERPGLVGVVLILLGAVVFVYNRWFLAGRTGQSWGRMVLGVHLVGADSGRPVGVLRAAGRDWAHLLDGAIFNLGYLLPLFTARKQTIADLVCRTVVVSEVPAPAAAPAPAPA
ncbi:RDD family protein [Actinoplanes couchii]|uniref:RDD domain-containing protein n=1 Tax=Actinoplanes couchii TaxID=403638 RepID=A0ABQ3XEP6_9ACTN|nr:RDD family protein [Actinoplanes couchii]MDR6319793.1 putative RDD family membrane protein YckC [Actinoplanes couchii]GID56928.1 hypothetical protein Aco03nite_053320 [Actinoplanes couchii]